MGCPQARKRKHKGDKPLKEKYRTKRKTKDIDQIHDDLKRQNAEKLMKQEVDYDKPGNAQHYCLHCAKYFISEHALKSHFKGGLHRKRLKDLSETPYTQEESERAGGMGSYVKPGKLTIKTQPVVKQSKMEVEATGAGPD